MTDVTDAAPENIDDRADYVMGLLQAEPTRDGQGRFASTEAPADEAAAPEQNLGDAPEAAPGDPASGDEADTTTEQAAEPAIALPIGWSAEKAEAFKQLPPDVREYITARESERNSHHSRSVQEAAEQRKAAEAERQAVSTERQRYTQALGQVLQNIQQTAPKPPDPALATSDPAKYIAQKAQFDHVLGQFQATQAEMQRVQAEEAEHRERAFQDHLADQGKILDEKIPEWRDVGKRTKEQREIAEFLTATGYSRQEVDAVADARAVQIARKAMLYDRLMAQKPAAKLVPPVAPPTMKPGAAATSPKAANLAAMKQRALATDDLRGRAEFVLAALNTR
ncbi:hypothetical protein E9232_004888 [Inquilinus ginsengisoli]|uniref:Scaffolding protein n=1 Tax=Inquilinus ginsengisoli TaxID=363840 RepID=A0ABU1JUQ2_9PROT|nr:hypothetical protein [Inquilinus ginsengisoli]MDR6292348.1 hypothetical protein [Inquilinus ginsengisoli]